MNVNCVNIEREEESLNITNVNLLVTFNKTREIFPTVNQVLNTLPTTAVTSASVERVNQKFYFRFRLPAMLKGELFAAKTQLMSKCL